MWDGLDDLAFEYVTSGIDLVCRWVLRLLEEGGDAAVLVGGYSAEGSGVTNSNEMKGDICIGSGVGIEHGCQVGTPEDITVEHDDVVGTELG